MDKNDKTRTSASSIIVKILLVLAFLFAIEFGARTYHFLKYKDPTVYFYGRNLIRNFIKNLGRQNKIADKTSANRDIEVDKIFKNRSIRDKQIVLTKPHTEIIYGAPSYINAFGLRNRDIDLVKPAGVTRIIAIGESFVTCNGISDKETWENILEEKLNRGRGRYEIINAGKGGDVIASHLANLINTYTALTPDYIILFSAHNDRADLGAGGKKCSLTYRVSSFLYNISQFYAMVREKSSRFLFKDNNYFLYDFNIALKPSDAAQFLAIYKKRLEQIITVCRERGIRPIFGLQPEFIPNGIRRDLQNLLDEKKLEELAQKLKQQNYLSYYEFTYYMQGRCSLIMKGVADAHGVLVFDGITPFPEDKSAYFADEIHLNAKGASFFADALYAFLVKNDIAQID